MGSDQLGNWIHLRSVQAIIGGKMTDAAVDAAEGYVERGKRQADAALETAREYGSVLEDEIATRPLTAIVVALGIGCIIGYLLRGR
jgi:hypothetical protein